MTADEFARSMAIIKELGWYVKFQPEPKGMMEQAALFEKLEIPVVLDHMGRSDLNQGKNDPTLRLILELLKKGNFWVMLSLTEKISLSGHPWDDVLPLAHTLIEAAPDRMIWGSDWPHPVSASPPPDEALLVNQLVRYAGDLQTLNKILVSNPAQLFGFGS